MKKSLFFCTGKRCLSSPQPIRLSVEYQLLTECTRIIQLLQTIRLLSAAERMQQFLLHRKERFCKRHFVDVRVEQAAGSRV